MDFGIPSATRLRSFGLRGFQVGKLVEWLGVMWTGDSDQVTVWLELPALLFF